MKPSILLDGLVDKRSVRWVPMSHRLSSRDETSIRVNNFSFLTNPNETLGTLSLIAEAETTCLSAQIDFLDAHCKDIGPWLVLAAMRSEMAPIFTGGKISRDMSKVISALKLDKALGFSLSYADKLKLEKEFGELWNDADDGHQDDVWAFPLRARRPAGTSTSETQHLDLQAAERVGGDLCVAINKWLDECANQELTYSGIRRVKKITGECLDNAERHSRREYANDGDWMITGFMAKRNGPNGPLFQCQLAFLSIGASIADTITDAPDKTLTAMTRYVHLHRKSLSRYRHPDDHLRTIFALQDTVTRDHDAAREGRGGTGFRDIVCLFGDLAGSDSVENDAVLAIVSGWSCLHIAHKYCAGRQPSPDERFNIWLNGENKYNEAPDFAAVDELEKQFCGTLITLGFTLDRAYLEKSINA